MFERNSFIKATENYNTFEENVPAYYFRRAFTSKKCCTCKLRVAVCGFYELYFNGKKITRGLLSPYISNPCDMVYYDEYNVTADCGENVIGLILGNGFQNNPGGHIWDFDKASFRSAPLMALEMTSKCDGEEKVLLTSADGFKVFPSPIRSDDYRFGEYYDANYEIESWNCKGFDDSDWSPALSAPAPTGEVRRADVPPIVKEKEISPVSITPFGEDFIYDFGESNAGVCRLKINGYAGQKIELRHADSLRDGDLNLEQIWFNRDVWERDREIVHRDVYVCRGGEEVYEPSFTYHGFRYVKVSGITADQATPELLTYLVYHTDLNVRGDFECSDPVANKLQEITRRSILSNFHHFPTDCPQREKNGWTADAALSSEAALMNFDPEVNYREWMRNICKAQAENGSLPGIVPTGGWGFQWGNGPAWDSVIVTLPYNVYVLRGETEMIRESAEYIVKYLRYLRTRCDENGLLAIGLGDWCHVGRYSPKAPLILTDSVISMDIARKAAVMFGAVGLTAEAEAAKKEAEKYRDAIRAHLIDFDTLCAVGNCQTSQAMCIFYGVFEESEKADAFEKLLGFISEADGHMDVGVLGGRVIFRVLSDFGRSDLAYNMITREDYPSYGNILARGATTLWEDFHPHGVSSMNHHFWGDISAWFIEYVAGIRLNPTRGDVNTIAVKPSFIGALDSASAYHISPAGKITVSWKRTNGRIILDVELPDGITANGELEDGFIFADGSRRGPITSGTYEIIATGTVSE